MGDLSIIARRLSGKYVQYGFCGGSGFFNNVGFRIYSWYYKRKSEDFPDYDDLIEYLFSLGETDQIGLPGSENGGQKFFYTHHLRNTRFCVGTSERDIFSKIMFIEHGYFFDSDENWYCINPGPFRIKIPFELVDNNLDDKNFEFDFLKEVEKQLMTYILKDYKNEKFENLVKEKDLDKGEILKRVIKDDFPVYCFFENYRTLFEFFDDWIVVKADENQKKIDRFIVREKTDVHTETIFWE